MNFLLVLSFVPLKKKKKNLCNYLRKDPPFLEERRKSHFRNFDRPLLISYTQKRIREKNNIPLQKLSFLVKRTISFRRVRGEKRIHR